LLGVSLAIDEIRTADGVLSSGRIAASRRDHRLNNALRIRRGQAGIQIDTHGRMMILGSRGYWSRVSVVTIQVELTSGTKHASKVQIAKSMADMAAISGFILRANPQKRVIMTRE
jgi:hypothetical protein